MRQKTVKLAAEVRFCFYARFEKEIAAIIRKYFAFSDLECVKHSEYID